MNTRLSNNTSLLLATCLFVASIVLVNATITGLRLDLTENRLFTLSEGTINILNNLDEPITLDYYFSQKELTGFPAMLNYGIRVRDLLEEYATEANGKLILTVTDPEPFSEEEDLAVAHGLRGVSVNAAGDRAYFGLVGINSTDDERVIPVFDANKEASLEYEISKLVYNLANPEKPTIGIMSSMNMQGNPEADIKPWAILENMGEFFNIEFIDTTAGTIDPDIDVLMVVHPKGLLEPTLYAIEQYLLRGGKGFIFVDPLAEGDQTQPDPDKPMVMPDLDSDLDLLFTGWGLEVVKEKIAGDSNAAMHVQTRSARGQQEVSYLPWLSLGKENLNQEDFSTRDLNVVNVGTAGILQTTPEATVSLTPLLQTTLQSMQIERDLILLQRDPRVMLDNFKSEERKQVLAARVQGEVRTAFPDGRPKTDKNDTRTPEDPDFVDSGEVNLIVAADTDLLRDLFWVREQNFFGMDIPRPIADNGDFVVNALDNLSGNTDLISLRSRGAFARPFEKVEAIRRQAEMQFREQEQKLMAKLREAEEKIQNLQSQAGGETSQVLTAGQTAEIEKFRDIRIKTRKELRSVQHELKKNIEALGNRVRFINIALIPCVIIVLALTLSFVQSGKRARKQ
ncbi:MAG: Gldg family protein [Thiotrichales bacterium]|nr:Gldg family protein [Thiotrichales bacterium]